MRIEFLLALLSRRYKEMTGIPPNKTKLIKLAYLAEIYFKRISGCRLTNQEWIYWKYGPYLREYDSIISDDSIFITPDPRGDYVPIDVRDDYEMEDTSLNENTAIISALEHASEELQQILDYVYFDTEPMLAIQKRGESLDFETVLPYTFYAVKEYRISTPQGKIILHKIKEWETHKHHAS